MSFLFHRPEQYMGQDYSALKSQCQANGQLFVDTLFPTNYKSLFVGGNQKIANIQWKRPGVR